MIFVGVKRIRLSSNDGNTHTIFISTKECNDIHPTIIKKLESLIQKSDHNPESDNWDLEEQSFGNERPWWEEFFNVLSGNLISLDAAQAVKIKQAAGNGFDEYKFCATMLFLMTFETQNQTFSKWKSFLKT